MNTDQIIALKRKFVGHPSILQIIGFYGPGLYGDLGTVLDGLEEFDMDPLFLFALDKFCGRILEDLRRAART